jgi:hypothetical protein
MNEITNLTVQFKVYTTRILPKSNEGISCWEKKPDWVHTGQGKCCPIWSFNHVQYSHSSRVRLHQTLCAIACTLIVLENLHMELFQRILISIQAACFPDFSLITNNYGYGWSWKNKWMCGLFTWHFRNLTSVFYLLDKRIVIFESK